MSEYNYTNQTAPAGKPVSKSSGIVSFIMGLLSVICPWSFFVAIIMSIVGLVLSTKAAKDGDTSGFVKAGRILSIVGLILSLLAILLIICYLIFCVILGIGLGIAEANFHF